MQVLTNWFKRYLSDPQVVSLALLLIVGLVVVLTLGEMLAPVLASVVIAYLLEGLVVGFQRFHLPRLAAVIWVFSLFMLFVALILFWLMPLLSRQLSELVQQLPAIIGAGQQALMRLPERYPELVSPEQIQEVMGIIRAEIAAFGQTVVSMSLASVVGVITLVVYLILMPLLVFFFRRLIGQRASSPNLSMRMRVGTTHNRASIFKYLDPLIILSQF